ncbi:DUF6524 family protein [Echinimonas agarilytica]|uniref:DUF6524 family protein n=1 Tax=Echinimonas agarilytica TaxID=1215918 RepID=A0AA42B608_9GAMM|nr:DUF6524 family protein [Echinimonas agarilytica]MCM2678263.1 DUF6524 family protein [Echinimonas agarilytica]
MSTFTGTSFGIRLLFAAILVFATYNPTGFSYSHWLIASFEGFSPLVAVLGIVLLIGWVVCLKATFDSLGPLGLVLGIALQASIVWLMMSWGWFSLDSVNVMAWVVLLMMTVLLAVGMSWSHLHRRLTGQVDVDEISD